MKRIQASVSVVLPIMLAAALVGCGGKEGEGRKEAAEQNGHSPEHRKQEGVSFSPKSGLLVPKDTADFIGLQIVEVEERQVASAIEFSAQVYQSAKEAAKTLASGFVSRTDSEQMKAGQRLSAATKDEKRLEARLAKVNPELQSANGMVEVLLEIDSEKSLKVGDYITASLRTGEEKKVVAVPREALLQTIEGTFVYTVSGDRLVRAPVKVGTINHEYVEITDGLYSGDQIAMHPVMTLWLAELQSIRGGKACADGH